MDEANESAVALTVNGRAVSVTAGADTPLLAVLRQDLHLKGSRIGCSEGYCGACTVLLDGNPVQSCAMPLEAAAGRAVTTIEGVASTAAGEAVRQAFIAEQAAQCGYCTNGIIMTVTGLMSRQPATSRADIIAVLDERNLCRCGSHARVLRALDRAMATLAGGRA
ncbi:MULTISPECIES: (2Fe-2S)-binding protein [Rhodomicrobium]|uniref:(2Fe-2S)-binding protein n=1 Tax=Rhodomicrobium TaxID=1068 RepID=UPI000B4B0295|nr:MULTISPECIES: (2Fe-2S)-binding protein [Rhodomicrobium]